MSAAAKQHKVYSVKKYNLARGEFEKYARTFTSASDLANILEDDNQSYHFRVKPKTNYILFGDIDKANASIEQIRELFKSFLATHYGLLLTNEEFYYTRNSGKAGSFHFAIPKWYATTEKMKTILQEFIDTYPNKLIITDNNGKETSIIDTSIYADHWFRCPYQSKGTGDVDALHEVVVGDTIDFIIDNIPSSSISITNIARITPLPAVRVPPSSTVASARVQPNPTAPVTQPAVAPVPAPAPITPVNNEPPAYNRIPITDSENLLSFAMTKPQIYMKLFDECYKPMRFSDYNEWIKVGMAILNTIPNYNDALNLFIYFSAKAPNYAGEEATKRKFESFRVMDRNGYTAKTLYKIAYQDNKEQAAQILNRNIVEFNPTDIARFLKIIGGNYYFYKVTNGNKYTLYCYNGKFWIANPVLLKTFITNELFTFLKDLLTDVYWNLSNRDFSVLKSKIDRLTTSKGKDEIIETYKEYNARSDIEFDSKWWLFGFNNTVYDLKSHCFRDYEVEDYITITSGYDWREPTTEEIDTVNKVISKIMPVEADRNTLLEILSTGLDGKNLERFIIFSCCGRNGKGLIDDLVLKTVGRYGMIANSSILFESPRTGSNPEKANLHKKRLAIYREPPKNRKFENAVIKELSGGGKFSARGHYDNDTEKELNCTSICECNDAPSFQEPLLNADIERLCDVNFNSVFTKDTELVNENRHIYLGNDIYKTPEFQEQHKFAMFKLLIQHYRTYQNNNYTITSSANVKASTKKYIENANDVVGWFKEAYAKDTETDETGNIIYNYLKIGEIYDYFIKSDFYRKMSTKEKDNWGKIKFMKFFSTNPFFVNYYMKYHFHNKYVIKGWHLRTSDNEEYDLD